MRCLFDWWAGVKKQINFGHLIIKKYIKRYCCIVISTSSDQSFDIKLTTLQIQDSTDDSAIKFKLYFFLSIINDTYSITLIELYFDYRFSEFSVPEMHSTDNWSLLSLTGNALKLINEIAYKSMMSLMTILSPQSSKSNNYLPFKMQSFLLIFFMLLLQICCNLTIKRSPLRSQKEIHSFPKNKKKIEYLLLIWDTLTAQLIIEQKTINIENKKNIKIFK